MNSDTEQKSKNRNIRRGINLLLAALLVNPLTVLLFVGPSSSTSIYFYEVLSLWPIAIDLFFIFWAINFLFFPNDSDEINKMFIISRVIHAVICGFFIYATFLFTPFPIEVFIFLWGILILFSPKRISWLYKNSALFNLALFLNLLFILLSTNTILTGKFQWFRLCFLLFIILVLLKTFYLGIVKSSIKAYFSPFLKKSLLVLTSLVFICLVLEGAFMFVARSHRYNGTLASRIWFNKYWSLNNFGHRERFITREELIKKNHVLFLGDSFCAGHGIKDTKNRFSDIVRKALPGNFFSQNAAIPGADTKIELKELKDLKRFPNILVLSYYANDIQQAGIDAGISLVVEEPYDGLNPATGYFIRHSFFLNYLYWNAPVKNDLGGYKEFLQSCYKNPVAFENHKKDLDSIFSLGKFYGTKIYVVLFPLLDDPEGSSFCIDPVRKVLEEDSIPFFDLRKSLSSIPINERVVNANDGHPSEMVHALVADSILAFLRKEKWLE